VNFWKFFKIHIHFLIYSFFEPNFHPLPQKKEFVTEYSVKKKTIYGHKRILLATTEENSLQSVQMGLIWQKCAKAAIF
jgi:hypothetical protein